MHKDIKPENLVFDDNGYLFLTDMGLARLCIPGEKIFDDSGTPAYMSPEIICCQPQDLTSDYYSLGVLLHELVFGKVKIL
jgi:serine/threonine protein kinase